MQVHTGDQVQLAYPLSAFRIAALRQLRFCHRSCVADVYVRLYLHCIGEYSVSILYLVLGMWSGWHPVNHFRIQ